MKKRLFAGALALLMIIGLLPVSSLLKKPMEAKAGGNEYNFSPAAITVDNTKDTNNVDTVFTFDSQECKTEKINATLKDGETKITDPTVFRFGGKATYNNGIPTNRYIEITVSKNATLSLKWASGSASRGVKVIKKESNNVGKDIYTYSVTKNERNVIFTKEIQLEANVVYYVAPSAGDMYIYSMVVTETSTETSTEGYTVTVVDSANSETPKTSTIAEGNNITYTAQGTNFAYWLNSNGVKVSTSEKLDMPVYYSDTYTAVYAKEGAKVDYLTPYGGIYETHYYSDGDFDVPTALTKYGSTAVTKNGGWELSYDEVMTKLKNDESFEVNPVYEADTSGSFEITIDTSAIDGNAPETKTYPSNKEVKASVTSENFGRWVDGKGNTLSYNSTYYFLANRNVTVKAVAKDSEEKVGVITYIEYANKTIVFEYTVPNEYTMTFAGVYASTNKSKVEGMTEGSTELPDGVYRLGADESRCGNYKTFRYTLKNSGSDIWYVKPILKYSGSEKPIVDSTVYTMN